MVFNAANILLVAAIAIAGMAVAFPVGIGLALVLGVILNYVEEAKGNPVLLFLGVALIAAAIVLNAAAYRRLPGQAPRRRRKGLVLSVLCGVLMSLFYYLVGCRSRRSKHRTGADDHVDLAGQAARPIPPRSRLPLGIFVSNFLFNTLIMYKPFVGTPVSYADYFRGTPRDHLWGIVGG